MSNSIASAEQQLVDLLGRAASYNDKGVEWLGHSPAKVAEIQSEFRQELLDLVLIVGAARLGQELVSAIESGAAYRDLSGEYATLAEEALGVRRSRA